jgi:hypothetical protein
MSNVDEAFVKEALKRISEIKTILKEDSRSILSGVVLKQVTNLEDKLTNDNVKDNYAVMSKNEALAFEEKLGEVRDFAEVNPKDRKEMSALNKLVEDLSESIGKVRSNTREV